MVPIITLRVFPALLGVIAGAGLCIVLINRVLGHPGLQNKKPFIPPVFVIVVVGMGVYGFFTGLSAYILLQLVIIIGLTILETGNLLHWHKNRGRFPVCKNG
jgi:hypothetical protein